MPDQICQAIERRLVRKTFSDLFAQGFEVSLDMGDAEGEERYTEPSITAAMQAAFESDRCRVWLYRHGELTGEWIDFVFGNGIGTEVINDYSIGLRKEISSALYLAKRFRAGHLWD